MESPDGQNINATKTETSLFESVCQKVQRMHRGADHCDNQRKFWMPDSRARQCFDCGTNFHTFRRRHHCRICGQVFCHLCSQYVIDAKMYKSCTGNETNGSVRVCKHCYGGIKRNEVQDFILGESSDRIIDNRKTNTLNHNNTQIQTQNSVSSNARINNWFLYSSFARRLSASTSLASLGEMVRTTITPTERKITISRPVSAASNNQDRRFSTTDMNNHEKSSAFSFVSTSSLDNIRTLATEIDDRIDESKPKWVREILEGQISKEFEQKNEIPENFEFDEGNSEFRNNSNDPTIFRSSNDKSFNCSMENLTEKPSSVSDIDFSKNIKLNFNSGETVVRYSSLPRSKDSRDKLLNSTSTMVEDDDPERKDSFSVDSLSYDMFRNLIPEDKDFFLNQQFMISERLDQSQDLNDDNQVAISNQAISNIDHSSSGDHVAQSLMEAIYDLHSCRILQQALVDEKLSLDWFPVINELSQRISNLITLNHHSYLTSIDNYYMDNIDVRQGLRRDPATTIKCGNTFYPMDIRQRVKIKTIPNGLKSDCTIINGVVFTKNVANRNMLTFIENARVLLFSCSIGYDERKRSLATTTSTSAILKLTSFDSMRMQENNYISNLVAKIASLQPQVIFVQGSVCRTALDLLFEKYRITVVLNVKRSILERIALFTKTTLIHSPDILVSTRIGICGKFHLQKFLISKEVNKGMPTRGAPAKKTLMFVEGTERTQNVGCSVILRGSSRFAEFRQLKSIIGYMVYVHYNSRLEKAFHLGLSCLPIEGGNWSSMGELLLHINKMRQRMNSNRSVFSRQINEEDTNGQLELKPVDKLSKSQFITISDNSDPLRSAIDARDDDQESPEEPSDTPNKCFLNDVQLAELVSNKLEKLVASSSLSCSPGIDFAAPFLMENDIHSKSRLRHYYPANLLSSERLTQAAIVEINLTSGISSNTKYQPQEHYEKDDDDFANFSYLSSQYAQIKREYPFLADAVNRKAESKLAPICNLLRMRYMVSKPHPLLTSNDYDSHCKNGKQLVADFRACGPYLRCVPDIVGRKSEPSKACPTGSTSGNKYDINDIGINRSRSNRSDTEQVVEPLSSIDQERISVLFSIFSPHSKNSPNYCFKPRILDISYYGRNDMSLGAFLFRHFFFLRSRFNQATPATRNESTDPFAGSTGTVSLKVFCSSETCTASMFRHLVRFSHHRGTLTVLLNKIHDSRNVSMPHKIVTWTFCVACGQKSSNVEMSADALALSFGKFLELKFYGDNHFNYNRYFASVCHEDESNTSTRCRHSLHKGSYQFFSYDQLVVSFKYDSIVLYEIVPPSPVICITRNQFSKLELINYLQTLTVKSHETFSKIREELDKNAELFSSAESPSTLLEDWAQQLRREESDIGQWIKELHIRISMDDIETCSVAELFRIQNKAIRIKKTFVENICAWNERINECIGSKKRISDKLLTSLMNRIMPVDVKSDMKSYDTASNKSVDLDKNVEENVFSVDLSASTESLLSNAAESSENESNRSNCDAVSSVSTATKLAPTNKLSTITNKVISKVTTKVGTGSLSENNESSPASNIPFSRFLTSNNDDGNIAIANPFEKNSLPRQYQMCEHYQLPTHKDVSIIVRDKDLGSIIAYALTTPEYDRKLAEIANHRSTYCKKVPANDLDKEQLNASGISVHVKNETDAEKHASSDLNEQIDVQFNDSSAKFYCCIYFAEQFRRLRSLLLIDGGNSNRDTLKRILPLNDTIGDTYAEMFYIHSLGNCVPWNAIGGKSGSTFSKTHNQRFILKEISKGELNHFVTFACDYIDYLEQAFMQNNPSAFVKIIGVYQISYKNTNKATIHHILVMENLFYECNISFIYDLKGSMRNRKVEIPNGIITQEQTKNELLNDGNEIGEDNWRNAHDEAKLFQSNHNQTTTVLMDENLRQISTTYPLYVHEHSKKLLMDAISRDSEFLREHGVMDYSLLLGFDKQFSEYVVGIIDYVRLFNWEKEIEFRVKKLANKAVDPTIVHPPQYQNRFIDAIKEYFIEVPDKWHPFIQLVPTANSRIIARPKEDVFPERKSSHSTDSIFKNSNNNYETNVDDISL